MSIKFLGKVLTMKAARYRLLVLLLALIICYIYSQRRNQCPPIRYHGRMILETKVPPLAFISAMHPELFPGGYYKPPHCDPYEKLAILIPFKNRTEHLKVLLHHLHPLLQRQQREYQIFVVEQVGKEKAFNKGVLYNAGFLEALKLRDFDCFIFHDVDLLPEDDRNLYDCSEHPRHMSTLTNDLNYTLLYWYLFGGVTAMRPEHYRRANGYSNLFWGWGGEDDDMFSRLRTTGLLFSRRGENISRFRMLGHEHQPRNKDRLRLLNSSVERTFKDGLSNVQYLVAGVDIRRLFYRIKVVVPERTEYRSEEQTIRTNSR